MTRQQACCPDCAYWSLTLWESGRHHRRLATYYRREATRHLAASADYSAKADRALIIGSILIALCFAVKLFAKVAAVMGG